jgi:hypothetical protein
VCCCVCVLDVSRSARFKLSRLPFLYLSSAFFLYVDVFGGVFRCDLTLGVGNAMIMRRGACATELGLMEGDLLYCVSKVWDFVVCVSEMCFPFPYCLD